MNAFPVMPHKCRTCPFRRNGLKVVLPLLQERALSIGTPICHSTGDSDVTPREKKVHLDSWLCRGARDFQIQAMFRMGLLDEPTDAAWEAKRQELGV
jgi:hypothetical protein